MLDRFTRDELHDELRRIFAIMTEQIGVVAGGEAASTFIGIENLDMDTFNYFFPEQEIPNIELSRFPIVYEFDVIYDQVFCPSSMDDVPSGIEMDQMSNFLGAIPKETIGGSKPHFLSKNGKAIQLAEYAVAIANISTFLGGATTPGTVHALSAREIALLGHLSEGTVRNAMSGKSPALKSFSLSDGSARVPVDVALRWLSERRGYHSRPLQLGGMAEIMLATNSAERARTWFATALHWNVGSADKAAEKLGWDRAEIEAALVCDFPPEEHKQRELARLCQMDEDSFVTGVAILKGHLSREKSK